MPAIPETVSRKPSPCRRGAPGLTAAMGEEQVDDEGCGIGYRQVCPSKLWNWPPGLIIGNAQVAPIYSAVLGITDNSFGEMPHPKWDALME